MAEVQGFCDPAFHSVRDVIRQRLAEGSEVGVSLCVTINGKDVLDLWSAYADASQTELKPWGKDTITGVWSTTKIVTSLAALILVDRGLLNINENVATYWPEFAANGKENIKVSQIFSHSSGVMTLERKLTPKEMEDREAPVLNLAEELQNLDKTAARLAEQPPWYVLGSRGAYTASIYGLLVGELVRRITRKSLSQFITEEITTPLKADFQLGLPDSVVSLDGTVDGKQYLTPQTLDEMMTERMRGFDPCLNG